MKVQACTFQRKKSAKWEEGLAWVLNFSIPDVSRIVDAEGKLVKSVYNYRLSAGCLVYINTSYSEDSDEVIISQNLKAQNSKKR